MAMLHAVKRGLCHIGQLGLLQWVCQLLLQVQILLRHLAGDLAQAHHLLLTDRVTLVVPLLLILLWLKERLLLSCLWALRKLCQMCDGSADVNNIERWTILTDNSINLD